MSVSNAKIPGLWVGLSWTVTRRPDCSCLSIRTSCGSRFSQSQSTDGWSQTVDSHPFLGPHKNKIISHEEKNIIYHYEIEYISTVWWSLYQAAYNLQQTLTFLIPQLTSEPRPCLVGLSRTTPSRYSASSSVLMWWGLSNGFSNPFKERWKKQLCYFFVMWANVWDNRNRTDFFLPAYCRSWCFGKNHLRRYLRESSKIIVVAIVQIFRMQNW